MGENENRRCECSNRPQGVIKWGELIIRLYPYTNK